MSGLIPVHSSITEMSERDRERLYLDDAPRWVGPTAPSVRDLERAEYWRDHCARRLADAVAIEDVDDFVMRCRSADYVNALTDLAQLELVRKHVDARGAQGFAGWIVR